MIKSRKILIYFYHCRTFGHTRRVFNIAQALASDPINEVLVISSGESPSFFKPHMGFEIVQIPALIPIDDSFDGYRPRMKTIPFAVLNQWRKSLIKECLTHFIPDVVILEMFPFDRLGLEDEFMELINFSRFKNPNVRVMSSMRDIPETEKFYWKNREDRTQKILIEEIDTVLVHGMKEIFDYSKHFENIPQDKFHYTGYVITPGFTFSPPKTTNYKGLMSTGGGRDGKQLLNLFIQYLETYPSKIEWTVVQGDYFPDQKEIEKQLQRFPNVKVIRNIILDGEFLQDYQIHICMAGYNTMIENSGVGIHPIVFPRTTSGEQKLRSSIFHKNALCHILNTDSTAQDLDLIIKAELNTPLNSVFELNLNGASNTMDLISTQLKK
jgi:predicted glycosyltransferase